LSVLLVFVRMRALQAVGGGLCHIENLAVLIDSGVRVYLHLCAPICPEEMLVVDEEGGVHDSQKVRMDQSSAGAESLAKWDLSVIG